MEKIYSKNINVLLQLIQTIGPITPENFSQLLERYHSEVYQPDPQMQDVTEQEDFNAFFGFTQMMEDFLTEEFSSGVEKKERMDLVKKLHVVVDGLIQSFRGIPDAAKNESLWEFLLEMIHTRTLLKIYLSGSSDKAIQQFTS